MNAGGAVRTLQTLIKPMVINSLRYANNNTQILEKIQNKIDGMIRNKCKIPNTVKYKLLHAHRDLRGMDIDTLSDLVGIEKIIIYNC